MNDVYECSSRGKREPDVSWTKSNWIGREV